MRDDEVLDAVIDFTAYDSLVEEIELGAIGPEAHNALRPAGGQARHLEQLGDAGVVNVYALLRRRRRCRCLRHSGAVSILILTLDRPAEAHAQNRCRTDRPLGSCSHLTILP